LILNLLEDVEIYTTSLQCSMSAISSIQSVGEHLD